MVGDVVDLTSLMLKVCLFISWEFGKVEGGTYPKPPESGEAPHCASEALTRNAATTPTNFLNIITSL
jgi:hypothetical protein